MAVSAVLPDGPRWQYSKDDGSNNANKENDGNQDCGPDVEAAGSGAVVSGTLQISSHLPVSGL